MGPLLVSFMGDPLALLGWIAARGFTEVFSSLSIELQQSRGVEQFALMLPPSIRVVFHYLFDPDLWLYGLMALFGTLTFIVSMVKIATLSRESLDFSRSKTLLISWLPFAGHGASRQEPPNSEIDSESLAPPRQEF